MTPAVQFTSKERDSETGLDYFEARYLSSAQGRFTSVDPPLIDQHAEEPQSWNLYSYARNNPLRYIDPTGHGVVDGEEHNWLWCAGHFIDAVQTNKEKQAEQQRYEEAKARWEETHPRTPYWLHRLDLQLQVTLLGELSIPGQLSELTSAATTARYVSVLRQAGKFKGNFGLGEATARRRKNWVELGLAKVRQSQATERP
ncbi:MAG: repeat-associated core domain protein [Bryobacterales bacterium]|nr:repeat-associated core domain protein [Bryobacterales bacterium]